MKDKELRKLIGSRAKQRRTELNLTQPYIAEKMGVTASTIQRYEAGTIDNTKKMVLEGLSEALHVSVEWLRGETDEYETDITDKRELQIRDAMTDILKQLPLDLTKTEDALIFNSFKISSPFSNCSSFSNLVRPEPMISKPPVLRYSSMISAVSSI